MCIIKLNRCHKDKLYKIKIKIEEKINDKEEKNEGTLNLCHVFTQL